MILVDFQSNSDTERCTLKISFAGRAVNRCNYETASPHEIISAVEQSLIEDYPKLPIHIFAACPECDKKLSIRQFYTDFSPNTEVICDTCDEYVLYPNYLQWPG